MKNSIKLNEILSGRLHMNMINEICLLAYEDDNIKDDIYRYAMGADERLAYNALWILSHFDSDAEEWLCQKQDELIEHAIGEQHVGKRRLLLSILNNQSFHEDSLRTDFIDFCISKNPSAIEPYAIRALCMKLAYKQCKFYPELLAELSTCLDMLSQEPLSPALQSTRRNIMKIITRKSH